MYLLDNQWNVSRIDSNTSYNRPFQSSPRRFSWHIICASRRVGNPLRTICCYCSWLKFLWLRQPLMFNTLSTSDLGHDSTKECWPSHKVTGSYNALYFLLIYTVDTLFTCPKWLPIGTVRCRFEPMWKTDQNPALTDTVRSKDQHGGKTTGASSCNNTPTLTVDQVHLVVVVVCWWLSPRCCSLLWH